MLDPGPLHLIAGKTDAETAAEFRSALRPLLEQIAAIMADARRKGMNVGWAIAFDQYGRPQITSIDVTKPL